jgi:HSP20 family protein
MPMTSWQSIWDLDMAQAQMEAVTSALMPVGLSSSGRLQLPSIEMQETTDSIIITAFLPGVAPEDVQLRVSPRALTFYGQRQTDYRSPFAYGMGFDRFQQTIPLPARVRDRQTQVAFRQGAIVVTLQKATSFWSGWAKPTPDSEPSLQDWTLMDEMRHRGKRIAKGWRQFRHWLGHRLQQFGNQLLRD